MKSIQILTACELYKILRFISINRTSSESTQNNNGLTYPLKNIALYNLQNKYHCMCMYTF